MFGQPASTTSTAAGMFGQPSSTAASSAPATSAGIFGQPASSTGTGMFGQTQPSQPATAATASPAFGSFGQGQQQQQQPAQSGGMIGAINKPATTATTSATPAAPFSFGTPSSSATGTAAPPATPATTSAFSFGSSIKPATTATPSLPVTTSTTANAPITAPSTLSVPVTSSSSSSTAAAAPSISVPATTATTTTSSLSTSTPAPLTSAPTSSIQFPSSLKNKTIEEIILYWNDEMENQVNEFGRQAASLKEWDKKILKNAERVGHLNTRVTEMETSQRNLEQGITYVTAQQAELESLLDAIDRELPKMVSALGKTPLVGSDADRSKTFDLAEQLQVQLNDTSAQLSRLVTQVNTVSNPKSSGNDSVTCNVAQILNNHFETLQWIEEQIGALQRTAIETQKMSERANAEHERLSLTKNY